MPADVNIDLSTFRKLAKHYNIEAKLHERCSVLHDVQRNGIRMNAIILYLISFFTMGMEQHVKKSNPAIFLFHMKSTHVNKQISHTPMLPTVENQKTQKCIP